MKKNKKILMMKLEDLLLIFRERYTNIVNIISQFSNIKRIQTSRQIHVGTDLLKRD